MISKPLFDQPINGPSNEPSNSPALLSLNSPWILPALLFLWVAMVYIGLLRFLLQTPAAQGRLLFPALIPLALLLTYGLSILRSRWIYIFITFAAFSTTLYSLFFVIPEAYALPSSLVADEIPASANLLNVGMGLGLKLVAAEVETEAASPGEIVWLTLYWQGDQTLPEPSDRRSPQYVLELFGRDDELVGKVQSYQGGGLYPAALWSSAEVVADRVGVRLSRELIAPAKVRLNLKLAGQVPSIEVGSVKAAPLFWPDLSKEIIAELNGFQLVEASLGNTTTQAGQDLAINVKWQVISAPGVDLTTFVHLGDPREPPLSQGDSPPLGGDYPTSLWDDGAVISDSYKLSIPLDLQPGRYPITIGMYDPVIGLRQTLTVDGQRQLNDAYLVGWITVEASPR